jgi:hypothetical protein
MLKGIGLSPAVPLLRICWEIFDIMFRNYPDGANFIVTVSAFFPPIFSKKVAFFLKTIDIVKILFCLTSCNLSQNLQFY